MGAAFTIEADADAFTAYARRVRPGLEAALTSYVGRLQDSLRGFPADVRATVESVSELTLRGGKRLRAVLMAAGYEAMGGHGGHEAVVMAGVSLELLQSYLLIHDDWMDGDDVRRGGPSVPAMLRAHFARHSGARLSNTADAFAVLAGDFAAGLALDALTRVPLPTDRVAAATCEMARIQRDVVLGQMCDVDGPFGEEPPSFASVERTHSLKTGSYTVRGPLLLGATLAGADPRTLEGLASFAEPLGVAFQLRDDVLGTFGDPQRTGKPATGDLIQGKRTALVAAFLAVHEGPADVALLARSFGRPEASAADLDALVRRIDESGAKRRVEERIEALLAEARRCLETLEVPPESRALLRGAAHTLGHREK